MATAALLVLAAQSKAPAQPSGEAIDAQATVKSLFEDFLHYSVLGRFDLAETYADALINHADLDPVELLRLSESNERSVDTLLVLIKNSTISDSAARVLQAINAGEHLQRKNNDRILTNIEKLGGPPQTEYNATKRLQDSGEYAIPWMIHALRDPDRKNVWTRLVRALPKIGKPAVNPLVEALATREDSIAQTVIRTLGELGYNQAAPYLLTIADDDAAPPERRNAAAEAISQIRTRRGPVSDATAADGFVTLAEQFYEERGSVRPDPRLNEANVWYWDEANQFLDAVPVPRGIFGPVMAMRCCERALKLDPQHADAIALWLAANIRREARLGMDVESGDATETRIPDPTRPDDFPRALYFTSAAGARYAHLALRRGVTDGDAPVALGAITGLRQVAGSPALLGAEDYKQAFVDALRFPDLVVRTRAALALGNALPRDGFRGSEFVTGILGDALLQTGHRNILVVDADPTNQIRIMNELRNVDTNVIGSERILDGIERAEHEFAGFFSAVFLSTSVVGPAPAASIASIRERSQIAATPILLLVQPEHEAIVAAIIENDTGTQSVSAAAERAELEQTLADLTARVGRTPLPPDRALAMAIESAQVLERVARDGRTAFDPLAAEPALRQSINSSNEDLRIASIRVLALLSTPASQQSIAALALDTEESESMRIPAFSGLSESAKRFGNSLNPAQVDALLDISMNEPDLRLRTAASHALGALNLAADKANQTILRFHRG